MGEKASRKNDENRLFCDKCVLLPMYIKMTQKWALITHDISSKPRKLSNLTLEAAYIIFAQIYLKPKMSLSLPREAVARALVFDYRSLFARNMPFLALGG